MKPVPESRGAIPTDQSGNLGSLKKVLVLLVCRELMYLPQVSAPCAGDQWKSCFHVRCLSVGNRLQDIDTINRIHAAYLDHHRSGFSDQEG